MNEGDAALLAQMFPPEVHELRACETDEQRAAVVARINLGPSAGNTEPVPDALEDEGAEASGAAGGSSPSGSSEARPEAKTGGASGPAAGAQNREGRRRH
jgi:hypothetical protein